MGALAAVKRSRGVQQFTALYLKNALVAWRNKRATLLRLFAPLFFLLLALLIDKALQADSSNNSDYKDVPNPPITAITPIPLCTADLYMAKKTDCFELIVSPNNTVAQAVINEVIAYNTQQGTPITAQFAPTMADANNFLLENPDTVIAGVHFQFDGPQPWGNNVSWAQLTGFILQTNSTVKYFKGTFQNPNTFVQLPAQSAVQRALTKLLLQEAGSTNVSNNLAWETSLQVFAHPTIATQSLLGQVLGPFVFAACMFSFVVQIANVVAEKELGLRAALRTMGMTDTSFWGSWCMWEVTLSFVLANAIIIFGLIMQFSLFLHNNYGLLFFLFFLFLLAMSSLAMLLAAFMKKTASAVSLGFTIFIIGWVMQSVVIFGVPYTPDYYKSAGGAITAIFSLFPWDLLTKGFLDLGAATVGNNPGLEWSQRSSYCQNIENTNARPGYNPNTEYIDFECVMSLNSIYWILTAEWIVYYLLAVYLDNIVPNEHGVRKSIWYPFVPSYWCPVDRDAAHHVAAAAKGTLPVDGEQQVVLDEDVAAEEDLVKGLLPHRTGKAGALSDAEAGTAGRNAVEVFGLQKRYNGSRGCFGHSCSCCGVCCTFEAVPPFWAIKGSWFHIPQNQLFCLLGPNGAGKTTTINCLTGLLPPTNGEALVYGEAISSVGGINRIRSMMGVCPQFDVLWGELTGREHLRAYGSVKGIPWDEVSQEADRLLEKVKLTYAADQRTSAYSGGMRRRLSVAIALLGDPKIVYLDEPTTGMDPISRRYVWDIIQEAKEGRAIVLTTHSMEEADILGDRIAIMARGRLRCVGTSIRLKQRFGAGYKVAVSVMSAQASQQDSEGLAQRAATVKSYFLERLGLSPVEESRAYIQFLVEREREPQLITFLAQLEQDRNSMGITDVQLSLTSLEEVFLTIARNAELEAAMAAGEGTQEVLTTALDGATFTVPLGAELVMDPTSQKYYKVKWVTDDNGKLVVMEAAPAQQDGSQLAYTYSAPAPSQMQLTAPPSIPVAAPVVGAPIGSNAYTVSATSGARPPSGGSRIGSSLLSAPPNAFASGTATAGSRPGSQGSRPGSQQGPVPRVSGTAGIELPGIPKY